MTKFSGLSEGQRFLCVGGSARIICELSHRALHVITFRDGGAILLSDNEIGIISKFISDISDERLVVTSGSFNNPFSPRYHAVLSQYENFLKDTFVPHNCILMCTEAAFACRDTVDPASISPLNDANYSPFSLFLPRKKVVAQSPFGKIFQSHKWYDGGAQHLISHREQSGFMTRSSELDFWYSEQGFLYLSYSVVALKVCSQTPYRIIIFDRGAVLDEKYWKLIFVFNSLNIRLVFFVDEDFSNISYSEGFDRCNIFSFSGTNSFIKIDSELFFSSEASVCMNIRDAHRMLLLEPKIINGFDVFASKFFPSSFSKERFLSMSLRAIGDFHEFMLLDDESKRIELPRYHLKWRIL